MRVNDRILRYMTIRVDEDRRRAREAERPARAQGRAASDGRQSKAASSATTMTTRSQKPKLQRKSRQCQNPDRRDSGQGMQTNFKERKIMSSNFEERDSAFGFEREYERAGMPGRGPRRMQRRKICRFCIDKVDYIDFKDVKLLAVLHAGTRQDSAPADFRRVRDAPAHAGRSDQARAQHRAAAVRG